MDRPRVYVAGPMSKPEGFELQNAELGIQWGQSLLNWGFAPMVPHLSHFWHERIPNDWETWLQMDEAWVAVAELVVRIPGESVGADREVALAHSLGIPVVHSLEEAKTWLDGRKEATRG